MLESEKLIKVFAEEQNIVAVIHFAAFKAVGESVVKPLKYFRNNIFSLVTLLECMNEFQIKNIVFSSSATVYGDADELPITENTPFKKALSAYGSSKQMGEDIFEKVAAAGSIHAISLRYFNPVGAPNYAVRKTFSIFLPLANSSTNLSKYRTCCVKGFSISSTRYPQITPVMRCALGFSEACRKNVSKVTFSFISSCSLLLSKPVNHSITRCNSSFVLPFFSTFARYKG
jgi:NAD dependent epimerase/dehydratase family